MAVCLALAAGLSACGLGVARGPSVATPGVGPSDMIVTPSGNRGPQAVGTIPAQTLTEGDDALTMDVAPYFQDPDGDPLTYAAASSHPVTVSVGMSVSTMTLTAVSAGTATVTVTARDDQAEATQTVATTVLQRPSEPPTGVSPEPVNPPREPEIELTGLRFYVWGSNERKATVRVAPVPAGARLPRFSLNVDPAGEPATGTFCCTRTIAGIYSVTFECAAHFTGVATITLAALNDTIRETVTITCQ